MSRLLVAVSLLLCCSAIVFAQKDTCIAINSEMWKPIQDLSPSYIDKANKAFAINTVKNNPDGWAAMQYVYTGECKKLVLTLTTLQETDGESYYKVYHNDKLLLEVQNPRIHGTQIPEYAPHQFFSKKVKLEEGDSIQVHFKPHSNGLVPEGEGFGYARARWRSVSIGKCKS